jgi:hypothetical protein
MLFPAGRAANLTSNDAAFNFGTSTAARRPFPQNIL